MTGDMMGDVWVCGFLSLTALGTEKGLGGGRGRGEAMEREREKEKERYSERERGGERLTRKRDI